MYYKKEKYYSIKPTQKEITFFEEWTYRRTLPKWKFILHNGILKEGMIFFIIVKLFQYILLSEASSQFYTSALGIFFLFFEVIFWFFGGYVVGWFKYNSNEIEYELIKGIIE
jgi:hypothetical protein